jgi:hypothetical protein
MKYKSLTKAQLIISIDRLTRFKNTKEKYLRVFTDILSSALIEPKFKKSDIEKLDYTIITEYASLIINNSIGCHTANTNTTLNEFLKDYENSVYVNDADTQLLLNNNINYTRIVDLLDEDLPVNLTWLKYLNDFSAKHSTYDFNALCELRKQYTLKFPIEKIILVEGITEEILLPAFSRYLGNDFYSNGVQIIAAGGKNQVVKMYYKLSQEIKLPIFVLLDKDAENNIKQIEPKLRSIDKIHLVSCGEFEDLLSKSLIVKTVNSHFENFLAITEQDLNSDLPTAHVLEELFKTRGLHEFKKAEFAKLVRENINERTDISGEISEIIKEIFGSNKSLDTQKCS